MKIIILIFSGLLGVSSLIAQDQKAFDQYRRSFKMLPKLGLSQKYLETNPHQKLKPISSKEAIRWILKPIFTKMKANELPIFNQGVNECVHSRNEEESRQMYAKGNIAYYRVGQVKLSKNYYSLLYFFVDHFMWNQTVEELYYFVINYSKEGEFIDGIVLGRTSKYVTYQVDITELKPTNILLIRNLGYAGVGQKQVYDHDHYYQIADNGEIKDIQLKYYPYNGNFVDATGNKISIEQNKNGIHATFWEPGAGYGFGIGDFDTKKPSTITIRKEKYAGMFYSPDKLVLTKSNNMRWVFTRKK